MKFVLEMVENIMGKEENVVTSTFSFSHKIFKSLHFQSPKMLGLCGKGLRDNVFCSSQNLFQLLSYIVFVVFKCFQFGLVNG